MIRLRRAARGLASLALLAGLGGRAGGEGEGRLPDSWRWLAGSTADASGLSAAPTLEAPERLVASTVLPCALAVASTPAGTPPTESDVVGSAFVLRSDGVLATSWSVYALAGRERWLWARAARGPWLRAIPLGGTWWADAGVLRLVTLRRDWRAVTTGDAGREALGERFLAVGCGVQHTHVASAGKLGGVTWFDPDSKEALVTVDRRHAPRPGKQAVAVRLLFEDALSLPDLGGAGSPVFDLRGACVGFVASGEPTAERDERVAVRPSAFVRPVLDAIVRDAALDPADLGAGFFPASSPADLPPEVRAAREKARGGAVVATVLAEGPSNGRLWEGDVVLDVDGRPLFAEVRESFAIALLALTPGIPVLVTVWRGGRAQHLPVTPQRARSIYPDFQRHHDAAAPPRLRLR